MTTPDQDLRQKAEAATAGPWHHCQPYQTVPKQRTIHGPVPAQRVDYVSTWPDAGTPKGHRVIAPMEGRESAMRSEDMAFIAACNPATVLALLDRIESAERALEPFVPLADAVDRLGHEPGSTAPHRLRADDLRAARAHFQQNGGDDA